MLKEELSLGEGKTPLIKAIRIPFYTISDLNLYFKDESRNPTGSYADRGTYNSLKKYSDGGIEGVITYSIGDVAVSVAAYASRLGINTFVLVAKEDFNPKKYTKLVDFDAKIIVVDATKEETLNLINEISSNYPYKSIIVDKDDDFSTCMDEIIEEIKEKIDRIDYMFTGVEKEEAADYEYFKSYFEKNGILCAGVTDNKTLAEKYDLLLVEEYEIEEAKMMMTKHEGLSKGKRAAIALAGIMKWDDQNGFDKGDNVVQFIDKRELKVENLMEAVESITEKIDADIDKLKEIMRLY